MENRRNHHGWRKAVSGLLSAALLLGTLPGALIPTAAAAETDEPVRDNLVLWLDANNNAGTGEHVADAEQWVNLANENETVDVRGLTWGEDEKNGSYYLNLKGGIYLPDSVREAIGGEKFTIEFLMDDYDGSNASQIKNIMHVVGDDAWIDSLEGAVSTANDNFVLFQNSTGGNNAGYFCFRTCYYNNGWQYIFPSSSQYCMVPCEDISGVTNSLTFNCDGKSLWYLDGGEIGSTNNNGNTVGMDGFLLNGTWQTGRKPQVVFGTDTDVLSARVPFSAKVRSIRIYSAELDADQVAANAAYDEAAYHTPYVDPKYAAVPEGYETDGLVLFLDGIQNTADGHNANAAAWTNLANAGQQISLNGNVWGSNYLALKNYIKLPEEVRQAIGSEEFTIEFLMDDYDGSPAAKHRNIMAVTGDDTWIDSLNGAVSTPNDNFVLFQNPSGGGNSGRFCFRTCYGGSWTKVNSTGNDYCKVDQSRISGATNTLTFDYNGESHWYTDGMDSGYAATNSGKQIGVDGFRTNPGTASTWQTERKPQVIFGTNADILSSREEFSAKVKAIRVYNRVLTAEEIAQNVAADSDRYISAEKLKKAVEDSWAAVLVNNASATTASDLQKYGKKQMTDVAERHLDLSVADNGDGTFTFTYKPKAAMDDFDGASHTLYVDADYELDFSTMTKDEEAAFLNDIYAHQGSGGVTATIADGKLTYTPKSGSRPVSGLYLPVYYSVDDYVWEMEVTYNGRVGGTPWAGQLFGVKAVDVNQNTCTFNLGSAGSAAAYEFCKRTQPNLWANHVTTTLSSSLVTDGKLNADKFNDNYSAKDGQTFTLKYVIRDGICFGYIDDVLVVESTNLGTDLSGGFGINSAGPIMNISSIRISTDLSGENITSPIEPYRVNVYEPDTAIAVAPTVMQQADSEHYDFSGKSVRPASLIFDVRAEEGVLNAYDGSTLLGTFAELYRLNKGQVIMGVRIADQAAADLMAQYVTENQNANLWIIAENGALINTVSAANPAIRGVVDVTGTYADMTALELYEAVYGYGYRTVLIDDKDISAEVMRDLQNMKLVVLVEAADMDTADLYDLVVAGPNGILTDDYAAAIDMLESFEDYTLVRNSAVVAHRGDRTYPDNSIESISSAAESGAAAAELDVITTKDGKLVLSHDDDNYEAVDYRKGTWAGTSISGAYWSDFEGKLYYTSNDQSPVEYTTLDKLFDATAEKYPDLTYHVEIKDYGPNGYNRAIDEIVKLFEMDKYKHLKARCDILCFNTSVNAYAKSKGLAVHNQNSLSTTGNLANDLYTYEKFYRNINSLLEPGLSTISQSFLGNIKHYGMTAYPWTANGTNLWQYYIMGYHGFTTDYSHTSDNIYKAIRAKIDEDTGKVSAYAYKLMDHDYSDPIDITDDVEIISVAGTPGIVNGCAFGEETDAVAVRYKFDASANVSGSFSQKYYYLYSEAFTPAARQVTAIEVTTDPSTANYIQDAAGKAAVDPAGAKITVTYNDGATAELDVTADMISYDGTKVGDQYVTVTYEGQSDTFLINIQPYSADKHVITALASSNGAISPSGSIYVADGGSQTFTVTAAEGYEISGVTVDGADQGVITSYTFKNVTGDHAIVASFKKISNGSSSGGSSGSSSSKSYDVKIEDVEGGIVKADKTSAKAGILVTVTITPDVGRTIEDVVITNAKGDEIPYNVDGDEYTFVMPRTDVSISVEFVGEATSGGTSVGGCDGGNDCPSADFDDVTLKSWFHDAVDYAVKNGITTGVTADTFAPNATCTRAQAVTFLWRAAGSPVVNHAMGFTDVPADAYYAEAVRWAVSEDITSGTNATTFSPDATCTRAQIVTFLWRANGAEVAKSSNPFVDVDANTYYANAVLWAAEKGITSGTSATAFSPSNDCTRAQIVTFIWRAMK